MIVFLDKIDFFCKIIIYFIPFISFLEHSSWKKKKLYTIHYGKLLLFGPVKADQPKQNFSEQCAMNAPWRTQLILSIYFSPNSLLKIRRKLLKQEEGFLNLNNLYLLLLLC